MIGSLVATDETRWDLTVLRATLAAVLWPHGAQKLFGWFGGFGFEGTAGYFTDTVGLPWAVGVLVILLEFFAPLLLLAGFATRANAAAVLAIMVGAATLGGHFEHGFFMNWFAQQAGEGIEFHLLAGAMAIALLIGGGGARSADAALQGVKDVAFEHD
ncbi:MAG: DoxX family protein [Nannocystaceae bacterium]|nr:DoxX family protein [Nannocystaceae bacterium]